MVGFACGVGVFVSECGEVRVLEGGPGISGDVYGWRGAGNVEGVIMVGELVNFFLCDPERDSGFAVERCEIGRICRGLR